MKDNLQEGRKLPVFPHCIAMALHYQRHHTQPNSEHLGLLDYTGSNTSIHTSFAWPCTLPKLYTCGTFYDYGIFNKTTINFQTHISSELNDPHPSYFQHLLPHHMQFLFLHKYCVLYPPPPHTIPSFYTTVAFPNNFLMESVSITCFSFFS